MDEDNNLKFLPITKLFPNVVTLLGLCCGLTAIKFTFIKQYELSIIFILIAAIVDGVDGRIARLFRSTSHFGAELDSFADFLSFGVAPAFLLYFWVLKEIRVIGWMLVMIYVTCMSIRLARFNISLNEKKLPWQNFFFTGVPAPLGALLLLLPVIITFQLYESEYVFIAERFLTRNNIAIYSGVIALLLVSNIPTFSAKHLYIPKSLSYIFMLIFGILIISLITKPWITLPIVGIIYILTIPISSTVYLYFVYKNH
ncbi:CDP-diacylglycerol--serine O-phosphatidyltransferase [Candidatus Mesenet endosymbiont of Agriotes lineatus]|uniref:CDP-diacylglycerol--serine O-phosphatidyltransferase n=1 Tax=Candidatus Mesenet endosymbiont of Agriotes lineatus TaxID=3077948 RepID=UPI0030D5C6D5